ncbi:MAG: hypothetical protein H8E66_22065 [Planctomycetes bacterium]|nr:hypothetical protein [Planctomycetota bacterium]
MQKILLVVLIGSLLVPALAAQEPIEAPTIEANVAGLKTQLESGLKARRPEEFAFITKVVTMVGNDQLSLKLVKSTFQWTRQNPAAKKYPFFYFQRALRERAKKLGITV